MAAFVAFAPQPAASQGLFDFLFGGSRRPAPPPQATPYADPYATPAYRSPVAPARPHYSGGGTISYCVRLCDGQHFPIQRVAKATPVEMCKTMCPASKTKIFSGSAIDHAVASDGTRYADLDNAFVYREKLVPDCTCNGKTSYGLAPVDVNSDPTLRAGDLVATGSGLLAYSGRGGHGKQSADFTPVDPSVSAENAAKRSSRSHSFRRGARAELYDSATGPDLRGHVR